MNKIRHLRQILLAAVAVLGLAAGAQAQPYVSPTFSSSVYINGITLRWHTPTINNNSTVFLNNCTVYLDTNAKIKVCDSSTLRLNNTTLCYHNDDYLWNGIVIDKDSRVIMDNSVISGARYGITATAGNNSTVSGYVYVNSSTIKNGQYGIQLVNYQSSNASCFINSRFLIDDDNKLYKYTENDTQGISFTSHIRAENSSPYFVMGCEFSLSCTQPDQQQYIEHVGYGIYNFSTQFTVTPYYIYNNSVIDTVKSSFRGFVAAINVINYASTSFSVTRSDFIDNINGINSENANGASLRYNSIDISNLVDNNSTKGVCFYNSDLFTIQDNKVFRTNPNNTMSIGMEIKNSGTSVKYIRSNEYKNLHYAIKTKGVNAGSTGFQQELTYPGLQIRCNNIDTCIMGIHNVSGKIASPQGIIDGLLGNTTAGNNFNSCVFYDILNEGDPFKYCYMGTMPNVSSNVTLVSSSHDCTFPDIAINGFGGSELKNYQLLLSQLNMDGSNNDASVLGQMRELEYLAISGLYSRASIADNKLDSLRMWYDIIDRYEVKYPLVEVLYAMGEYEEAAGKLTSIPNEFNLSEEQQNEFSAYLIFFNLQESMREAGRYWDGMTANDEDVLLSIAKHGSGRAKGIASGILCFFRGLCGVEDSSETCSENINLFATHSIKEDAFANMVNVYPNPAGDIITIELPFDGSADIFLYNTDGTLVKSKPNVTKKAVMDVGVLHDGIYFYRVVGKENIYNGKFVKGNINR